MAAEPDVRSRLASLTVRGEEQLVRPELGKLRCLACGHRCLLGEGREGVCKVRFVRDGVLRVPFGYVAGLAVDPIEKKPFFHVTPGARALSFGMLGCDLRCGYCQNWETSQTIRDEAADDFARPRPVTADEIVEAALESGSTMVTSTYNEPLITSEWAVAVFRQARRHGLLTSYVSNGNGTAEVLDFIRPWVDAYKVDLKSMRPEAYRQLGGRLDSVLETISSLVARGVWVEVVTLVVPGFNDSEEELREAARFLAGVSPDLPWHVTAYHDDYKMGGRGRTPSETLQRAASIGKGEGLRFVYAGNLPGDVAGLEDTRCPGCEETLVRRRGFRVTLDRLSGSGGCPKCRRRIPGLFTRGGPVTPVTPDRALVGADSHPGAGPGLTAERGSA